jgi:hypothetical protein
MTASRKKMQFGVLVEFADMLVALGGVNRDQQREFGLLREANDNGFAPDPVQRRSRAETYCNEQFEFGKQLVGQARKVNDDLYKRGTYWIKLAGANGHVGAREYHNELQMREAAQRSIRADLQITRRRVPGSLVTLFDRGERLVPV